MTAVDETGRWWRARMDRIAEECRCSVDAAGRRFDERVREVTAVGSAAPEDGEPEAGEPEAGEPGAGILDTGGPVGDAVSFLVPANLDVRARPELPAEVEAEPDEPPTSWLV